MSVFSGAIVPRVLSGIMGVLSLLLAWGGIQSVFAYGPSAESVLILAFAVPLALICLSVAIGCAPFKIRE
jgi:hypothetical protein